MMPSSHRQARGATDRVSAGPGGIRNDVGVAANQRCQAETEPAEVNWIALGDVEGAPPRPSLHDVLPLRPRRRRRARAHFDHAGIREGECRAPPAATPAPMTATLDGRPPEPVRVNLSTVGVDGLFRHGLPPNRVVARRTACQAKRTVQTRPWGKRHYP